MATCSPADIRPVGQRGRRRPARGYPRFRSRRPRRRRGGWRCITSACARILWCLCAWRCLLSHEAARAREDAADAVDWRPARLRGTAAAVVAARRAMIAVVECQQPASSCYLMLCHWHAHGSLHAVHCHRCSVPVLSSRAPCRRSPRRQSASLRLLLRCRHWCVHLRVVV